MAKHQAHIRASDAERGAVVAQLEKHYAAGRLTLSELEERTRRAYAAKTLGDLEALSEDLPAEVAGQSPPVAAPLACGRRRWGTRSQVATFLSTALFFVAIWALTGRGYFWPAWPLLGWGVALVARALRGPEEPRQLRHTRPS